MRKLTMKKSIQVLEQIFGIKLSHQQKKIVAYGFKAPLLVNACAGSGKTTLLLFKIMVAITTKSCKPSSILGITFSKKAQLHMFYKYQSIVNKLRHKGYRMPMKSAPNFLTFHSLFYRILLHLNGLRNSDVLPTYTKIEYPLSKSVKGSASGLTSAKLLRNIFEFRDKLINMGLTLDGLHFSHKKTTPIAVGAIAQKIHIHLPLNFFKNYITVLRQYNKIKQSHNLIDFSDMQSLLIKRIHSRSNYKRIKKLTSGLSICCIDEFQDISNVQWRIIRKILPKAALKHLLVIGDDDQSIYSFRGSNPSIIINFTKKIKNAKRMDLSVNYRTNKKVLDAVKPLITNNKYRMDKSLEAANSRRGGIYEYSSENKYHTSGDVLLLRFLSGIRSQHIHDNDLALLVRRNADKVLAVDWLASHHIYVPHVKPLQKNSVYRIIMNVMSRLYVDDFSHVNYWSRKIGFKYYYAHIIAVLQAFGLNINSIHSLSEYLSLTHKYDNNHGLGTKKVGKYDKNLIVALKVCDGKWNAIVPGTVAIHATLSLLKNYFEYMCENNFLQPVMVKSVLQYMKGRISQFSDIKNYFHEEMHKRYIFMQINNGARLPQEAHINLMTIHQSKGLQFKYVFLYNLIDGINGRKQLINNTFTPDINEKAFFNKLIKLSPKSITDLDGFIATPENDEDLSYQLVVKQLKNYIKHLYHKKFGNSKGNKKHASRLFRYFISAEEKRIGSLLDKHKFNKSKSQKEIQGNFNAIYTDTIHITKDVEEARRVIYVGCTRAENSVEININNQTSALLGELKLSTSKLKTLTKKGNLLSLSESKAQREKRIDAKINHLEHLKKYIKDDKPI